MSETRIIDPLTGGMKGIKDIQLHALPWEALQPLGRVYAFGAQKYEDYNFRKGYQWSLSFDAMLRHLLAFWAGEDLDPESGLPHTSHAAWHALTLSLFAETGVGTDDRPPTTKEEQWKSSQPKPADSTYTKPTNGSPGP